MTISRTQAHLLSTSGRGAGRRLAAGLARAHAPGPAASGGGVDPCRRAVRLLLHLMAEAPASGRPAPQMRRAKAVGNLEELVPLHAHIFEHIGEIALRKLAVIFVCESNGLFTRDMAVANFLPGLVGAAANAELDERAPIVKSIQLVVDGVVFRVRPLGSMCIGFEIRVFDGVVVVLLWNPFQENRLCMTIRSPQMLRWKG